MLCQAEMALFQECFGPFVAGIAGQFGRLFVKLNRTRGVVEMTEVYLCALYGCLGSDRTSSQSPGPTDFLKDLDCLLVFAAFAITKPHQVPARNCLVALGITRPQLLGQSGITIVCVTHELDIARFASRLLVMRDGRVIEDRRQRPVDAAAQLPPTGNEDTAAAEDTNAAGGAGAVAGRSAR